MNDDLFHTRRQISGTLKALRRHRVMGILLAFLGSLTWHGTNAQDPLRFEEEVTLLKRKNDSLWDQSRPALVFTGSSSIRMWEDLQERFPERQILNTGFGGSQASDLLFYLDELILDYRPVQVFIYEGDNDLAEGKRPGQVLRTFKELREMVHRSLPGVRVVFISAKPSLSRWKLRRKYRRFNRRLMRWTSRDANLLFADVWNPMVDGRTLDTSLFIEDGLHMNAAGYDIWASVLKPFMDSEPETPER